MYCQDLQQRLRKKNRVLILIFSGKGPIISVIKRVAFDQTVFASFIISYIFFNLAILEGKTPSEAVNNVRQRLWPALLTNWKVWPFVQFMNFTFIPVPYHMMIVNVVSVFWNTYMSWMQTTSVAKINA